MATKRRVESGILASVHKAAAGLHKAGLMDKATMREFDALCLTPVEPVSKSKLGEKRPDGPSLKLLNLVKAKGLQAIA